MADPSKPKFKVPDLLPPSEIDEVRLARRRRMRDVVDQTVKDFEATENAKLLDGNFHTAFRLMTSTEARDAFDLEKEKESIRFEDIKEGIRSGELEWDQLEFSKECLRHIQRNIHILDN